MNQKFLCPITHQQMVDPVVDFEGNSYERQVKKYINIIYFIFIISSY